jgi:hypothetical protein
MQTCFLTTSLSDLSVSLDPPLVAEQQLITQAPQWSNPSQNHPNKSLPSILHNPPPQTPHNPRIRRSLLPFLLLTPLHNSLLSSRHLRLFDQRSTLPTPLPPLRNNALRNPILRPMSGRRSLNKPSRLFLVSVAGEPVVDGLDGVRIDVDGAATSGRWVKAGPDG